MASRLILCVFMVFATFLLAHPAWSQATAEPFTIRGVDIDVTANSSNVAKEQAIADGQRQAFQRLLERVTSPKDRGRVPKADGAEYVTDYSIEAERSSSIRYIATLNVRFNGAAVRRLLKNAGIAMIEPIVRPVVVIPVYRSAGQTVIWEESNSWRSAWQSQGKGSLVAIVIPTSAEGPLPPAETVIANDSGVLMPFGGRYHTSDVLVVSADVAGDGHKIEIQTTSVRGGGLSVDPLTYTAKSGESTEQMMARAVREIVQTIESQTRQNVDAAGVAPKDNLSVIVPLSGLEEWVSVRDRLSRGGVIRRWELVSLTRSEAAIVLHLAGDADKVKLALSNVGLDLQSNDGFWLLKPMSGKR